LSRSPFTVRDLDDLQRLLLARADRVVAMVDIFRGDTGRNDIGLRHDVDDNAGSLDTALAMAEWEHRNGYRSSYYLLHDSHYWDRVGDAARDLESLGHEVGIHVNAIAEGLRQHRQPTHVLRDALDELRQHVRVVGCVAHGDDLCHQAGFVNDEMFLESARPDWGEPQRRIEWRDARITLNPVSRSAFGLAYDAIWLGRGHYMSDSGGQWSVPIVDVASEWPSHGQLHILQHPDWWAAAFATVNV